jgi:hypothetical protein
LPKGLGRTIRIGHGFPWTQHLAMAPRLNPLKRRDFARLSVLFFEA